MKANRQKVILRIARAIQNLTLRVTREKAGGYTKALAQADAAVQEAVQEWTKMQRRRERLRAMGTVKFLRAQEHAYRHPDWYYTNQEIERLQKLRALFELVEDENVTIPQTADYRDLIEYLV